MFPVAIVVVVYHYHSLKMKLRDYQQIALDRILWAQKLEGNDICVLPTGAGKSVVIAHLANAIKSDILIIQPTKEILEQNVSKLLNYVDKEEIGIYSASMNEKTIKKYTFATIGSIYKKPQDFEHFKMVIIDECHLVNMKNLDGMFTQFLKAIGSPKVVGFTATPYRMSLNYKWDYGFLKAFSTIKLINRMKPFFWSRIIYNINNKELFDAGYLCPLEYVDKSIVEHEFIPTNKSESDFNLEAFDKIVQERDKRVFQVIMEAYTKHKGVLVFCSSVAQATRLYSYFPESEGEAEVVTALTPKKERADIINGFKAGEVRVVFNVGVLTIGFDHPQLDCIILLRPTRSIALYYQMLGRGVRIAEGKTSCKIIDMTGTINSLGRIETIELVKEDKWELKSETKTGTTYWHNKYLYSFKIK